jgi:hypothetical protein
MAIRTTVLLLIVLGFSHGSGFSQAGKTINLDEISQRKVRQYIVSRSIDQMQDFSLIKASWKKNNIESDYKFVERTFYLKYKLQDVWNFYRHVNLARLWNSHSVRFGLMISKRFNSVAYKDDLQMPEIDTGQVYFFDIRLLKGVFNIPAAFEITNIDPINELVEFSYLDGNKSLGKQTIQFYDNGNGETKIIHRSYFKSESAFRDRMLYPPLHTKFIKQFHRSIKQQISKISDEQTGTN